MDATDLTDALHDLRWKQVDLARKLGVHVNTVSSWATGSAMVPNYAPPVPAKLRLAGPSGKAALDMAVAGFVAMGKASAYDAVVGGELATVLSGGDTDHTQETDEDTLRTLERQAFMRLLKRAPTLARIEHMLETGRPLRN